MSSEATLLPFSLAAAAMWKYEATYLLFWPGIQALEAPRDKQGTNWDQNLSPRFKVRKLLGAAEKWLRPFQASQRWGGGLSSHLREANRDNKDWPLKAPLLVKKEPKNLLSSHVVFKKTGNFLLLPKGKYCTWRKERERNPMGLLSGPLVTPGSQHSEKPMLWWLWTWPSRHWWGCTYTTTTHNTEIWVSRR